MTAYFLAVDGGSQSTKVSVVDASGRVHASSRVMLRPYELGPDGRAVHPDDDLWDSLCAAVREAMASFAGSVDAPAFASMAEAMQEVYGRAVTLYGSGGSIPLCNVFQQTFPDAEIMLLGVEEPRSLIHAPNESVDPTEISAMALTEALFLQRYAAASS